MAAAIPSEIKPEVDAILEAIVYLYTESRRSPRRWRAAPSSPGPQLTVLKMLEEVGDLSLSELSERIRAQNSTVTGIIDRMEREGLVVRARSTEDRRVVHIRLTDKGAKIAREIAGRADGDLPQRARVPVGQRDARPAPDPHEGRAARAESRQARHRFSGQGTTPMKNPRGHEGDVKTRRRRRARPSASATRISASSRAP